MKKIIAIISAAVLCICLGACNNTGDEAASSTDATAAETTTRREIETLATVDVDDEVKTLVAYFDPAGELGEAVRTISAVTGGTVFEITTEIDYGDDVYAKLREEITENYTVQPDIKDGIMTEDYGIIFIGFPAVDGKLPAEVYSFININDFRDKIIIPFVTGSDSDCYDVTDKIDSISHGTSQALMLNLTGGYTAAEVNTWLSGLGY